MRGGVYEKGVHAVDPSSIVGSVGIINHRLSGISLLFTLYRSLIRIAPLVFCLAFTHLLIMNYDEGDNERDNESDNKSDNESDKPRGYNE